MPVVNDPTKIDDWLKDGATVASIMQRSSWGRSQVTARAHRMGMLIDPSSDTASRPSDSDVDHARDLVRSRPAPDTAAPQTITEIQSRPARSVDGYAELLNQALQSDRPVLKRRAERILAQIVALRVELQAATEAAKIWAEVDSKRAELAKLEHQARSLTGNRGSFQAASGASGGRGSWARVYTFCERHTITITELREWAQGNGFDLRGPAIPNAVLTAYDAAHEQGNES